jgi:LPS O-antigen subunit length determinant protein (WzzB/FepE family)
MKKKSLNSNTEIDLVELIKTIWDGRIKIFLITIILFTISYGYNLLLPIPKPEPKEYKSLLTIQPTDNLEFYNLFPMYDYLNSYKYRSFISTQLNSSIQQSQNLRINNVDILREFVKEILDYEELVNVLRNNKSVIETISNLTEEEQKKKLYDYAKLLNVVRPDTQLKNDLENYIISFVWIDPDQSKEILDQTIKLAIINLQTKFFQGLETLLEMKRADILMEDQNRIEYLKEQSLIAKELGLEEDAQVDNNVSTSSQYNLSLNINNNNIAYYLRGYKAIDKEISIIKKRKHTEIVNLKNNLKLLRNKDFEWIKYNIFLLDTKLLKKTKLKNQQKSIPLYLPILFGLIIGVFYVFTSNALRSVKYSKR